MGTFTGQNQKRKKTYTYIIKALVFVLCNQTKHFKPGSSASGPQFGSCLCWGHTKKGDRNKKNI